MSAKMKKKANSEVPIKSYSMESYSILLGVLKKEQ